MSKFDELATLLQELVAINSVNPSLVPGAEGEEALARFIADWLRARGLEVYLEDTILAGRPNVVAIARGSGGGRSLLLNAHMDTVGMEGMEHPGESRIHAGKLYGRGALDTKGGLAAFMLAAVDAQRRPLRGDVILAAVADEEYASRGTEGLVSRWPADAAIVTEPTGLCLTTTHKGFVWFEIETQGFAAHGSEAEIGIDAIAKMGKVLVALDRLATQLAESQPHPLLGTGSIHASLIQGGQELSSYPARCLLSIERRTIPGESVSSVRDELQRILKTIRVQDSSFQATLRTTFVREPLEGSPDSPIVKTLHRNVQKVLGHEPKYTGSSGWMDAALLAAAGIPTVVFGPDGEGLHGAVEWVDLESVQYCYESVLATVEDFCD
ncbi:MAG TPA: ArgE/DapE family deacylase [Ktedonobacteraceae bacterium]|nr:ArgE/DapE family deacylase [Ktedonobacteraceae bacterium]